VIESVIAEAGRCGLPKEFDFGTISSKVCHRERTVLVNDHNLQPATVFVAKDSPVRREAICAAVGAAGMVAHPVQTVESVPDQHDENHPACLVADLPAIRTAKPELIEALVQSELDTPVELAEPGADTHTLVVAATCLNELECALETGGVTFLRRPYSRQQLLEAIDRAVARDQVYQHRLAARHDVESRVKTLTDREREVMQMIYDGLANKVIAMKLEVSTRTVESIRAKIFDKMGVETAVDLTRRLAEADYFDAPND